MPRYTLQAFKSDVLQAPLNQGATSGTLTSGAFGSPSGPQLLVIDPETPAKREIISATISGTALTGITRGLDGTADVTHAANAPVIMAFVPSHYSQVATAAETGWIPIIEALTYASADAPTFTMTAPGDLTTKYSVGMRIKLTQTTVKYFILTAIAHSGGTTTFTLYGGTDYTLANAAITDASFSIAKAPLGFPLDPNKWTVLVEAAGTYVQTGAVQNTWYNLGTTAQRISVPIGAWLLSYQASLGGFRLSVTSISLQMTLSTTDNSDSHPQFRTWYNRESSSATQGVRTQVYREHYITVAAKTLFHLNTRTLDPTNGELQNLGGFSRTYLRAVSAYL